MGATSGLQREDAERIPLKMEASSPTIDPRTALEAAGAVFLGPAEDHPEEQLVFFPQGWHITPDDFYHPEYPWVYYLRDAAGNVRAIIDHTGEYDFFLLSRFFTLRDSSLLEEKGCVVVDVIDSKLGHGEKVIFSTEPLVPESEEDPEALFKKAKAMAVAWLEKEYPDWQDPNAYWEN